MACHVLASTDNSTRVLVVQWAFLRILETDGSFFVTPKLPKWQLFSFNIFRKFRITVAAFFVSGCLAVS